MYKRKKKRKRAVIALVAKIICIMAFIKGTSTALLLIMLGMNNYNFWLFLAGILMIGLCTAILGCASSEKRIYRRYCEYRKIILGERENKHGRG